MQKGAFTFETKGCIITRACLRHTEASCNNYYDYCYHHPHHGLPLDPLRATSLPRQSGELIMCYPEGRHGQEAFASAMRQVS